MSLLFHKKYGNTGISELKRVQELKNSRHQRKEEI
jgi:hypothetical protein